jgi:hypothetical protein
LAEAAATPGMTKAELVVEVVVIRFALLEEWVYLVEKAAAILYAQRS